MGILVVLVSVAGLMWWRDHKGQKTGFEDIKIIEGFDKSKVTKIEIAQGTKKVSLAKEGDVWKTDGKSVKATAVSELLDEVEKMVITQVASRNPDNHAELDLGNEFGYKLTVDDNVLIIGHEGKTVNTFYVKKENADVAYVAEGQVRLKLSADPVFWLEAAGPNIP